MTKFKMRARLADLLLKSYDVILRKLHTSQARLYAKLGAGTQILSDGHIVNLGGEPDNIQIGDNCRIRGELLTFRHAGQIVIGDWLYVGPRSTIWSSSREGIVIGDRVLISADVMIHDTNSHPVDAAQRFEQTQQIFLSGHPKICDGIRSAGIRIGNDVWIGYGATILKGVSIGDRSIVGARAIVSCDLPDDSIVRSSGPNNMVDT